MENFRLEGSQENSNACLGSISNYATNTNSPLAATSSKFTIPELKPSSSLKMINTPNLLGRSSSNINQFLMKQLEQQANNGHITTERFNVPKLEKVSTAGFVIPELKSGKPLSKNSNAMTLLMGANNHEGKQIQQNDDSVTIQTIEDHIIDLTTALSATKIDSGNNTTNANQSKQKTRAETFEIPFIECDRQQQLPQTDNYCLIDISHIKFQHNLAQPSTLGRILSSRTKRIQLSELPAQKTTFKAKHRVERFAFDTKSPDDIVLASLNRVTRAQ